jgi:hypothetical protein
MATPTTDAAHHTATSERRQPSNREEDCSGYGFGPVTIPADAGATTTLRRDAAWSAARRARLLSLLGISSPSTGTVTARTGAGMTRSAVSPRLCASQRQNVAVRVLMMRGDEQESQEQAMTRSLR